MTVFSFVQSQVQFSQTKSTYFIQQIKAKQDEKAKKMVDDAMTFM